MNRYIFAGYDRPSKKMVVFNVQFSTATIVVDATSGGGGAVAIGSATL
jgi:hypothetical protein